MRYVWEFKIRKAAKIRNRYNQVPHLTQDTTWESDKTIKHHKQEPRGQTCSEIFKIIICVTMATFFYNPVVRITVSFRSC